jgi:hypothetical protein
MTVGITQLLAGSRRALSIPRDEDSIHFRLLESRRVVVVVVCDILIGNLRGLFLDRFT